MENNKLTFKTNLNCSNCIAKVQADLDKATGIVAWDVDTNVEDKILTVQVDGASEDEIVSIIKKKGFKAALIEVD